MKYETLKNYLSSRSRLVRKLQLVLFDALRRIGLSKPLSLVRGVCYLKAKNRSALACEGIGLVSVNNLGRSGFAQNELSPHQNSYCNFIEVSDGHCLVTSGYFEVAILDRKRRLISELSPDTYPPHEHRALRQMPLRREVAKSICVLITPGARANYYHWMVDLMPAFRMLKAHEDYGLRHAALLINHSEFSYQRECIDVLGLDVDVINARPYTLYSAAYLYARELPSANSGAGERLRFTVQDSHFLRSLFNIQESKASINLYVVRGHTKRRRIRNESEVISLMGKLGFEIFDPSDHSVHEQARQFANARKILGFHGAGLTNTIFCGRGTKVIEIYDRGYAPDYYSNIASQLNFEYHRIIHEAPSKHRSVGIAEDITVDVGTLGAELKRMI